MKVKMKLNIKINIKTLLSVVAILTLGLLVLAGCNQQAGEAEDKLANKAIILSTTTSTENSGLLDYLLPKFTEETGVEVKVVAVGTGKALQMGQDGEADILLVHAKSSEEEFVAAGHGTERHDVMYNDFVLIGPAADPVDLKGQAGADILAAFRLIAENQLKFFSRGDESGTHKMEKNLWAELGIAPEGEWYLSTGRGMGEVIQMTNEGLGYTLTDRATYLSMKDQLDVVVLVEGDTRLFNQYGVIPVNPNKNDKINAEGARIFMNWLLSEKGQQLIGEFGKEQYGDSLFIPNYQK